MWASGCLRTSHLGKPPPQAQNNLEAQGDRERSSEQSPDDETYWDGKWMLRVQGPWLPWHIWRTGLPGQVFWSLLLCRLPLCLWGPGQREGSDRAPGAPWGWKETCGPKGRSQAAVTVNRVLGKGRGMTAERARVFEPERPEFRF